MGCVLSVYVPWLTSCSVLFVLCLSRVVLFISCLSRVVLSWLALSCLVFSCLIAVFLAAAFFSFFLSCCRLVLFCLVLLPSCLVLAVYLVSDYSLTFPPLFLSLHSMAWSPAPLTKGGIASIFRRLKLPHVPKKARNPPITPSILLEDLLVVTTLLEAGMGDFEMSGIGYSRSGDYILAGTTDPGFLLSIALGALFETHRARRIF